MRRILSLWRIKPDIYDKKLPSATSRDLFLSLLSDLMNPKHEPASPADKIDGYCSENGFKDFYSQKPSRPAMPIRLMLGVLMLKYLYRPGDEKIPFAWESNPYFQYFCGNLFFERKFPCNPSDFVHFRRRIGEAGSVA
jgi:IS5 family transposase